MASENASNPAPAPSKLSYSTDPALYIYTSLTAGSSHIVTATSRLETILRANKVPFKAIDLATDEKARMLWGRRSGKDESGRVRKLPGLVQEGTILGDLVEIEDWNEYGELKQHVKIYYDEFTQPSISQKPKAPVVVPKPVHPFAAAVAAASSASSSAPTPAPASAPKQSAPLKTALPIRSIAEEAAQKAKQVHLQGLRDKVYGKGGAAPSKEAEDKKKDVAAVEEATPPSGKENKKSAEEESPATAPASPPALAAASAARGLQSPTTGGWKDESALPTIQSPTTTSWKPTDIDAPITTYLGSVVASATAEEIAAIERAETIQEEEEEDDSEEESEEDSSEEEEEEEEEKGKKEEDNPDKKEVKK